MRVIFPHEDALQGKHPASNRWFNTFDVRADRDVLALEPDRVLLLEMPEQCADLVKAERIVVETKMTRETLGANEVGEELLADIARYEAAGDCDSLVCLVYDPARHILNPRGLERDLEKTPSRLAVRVRVRS